MLFLLLYMHFELMLLTFHLLKHIIFFRLLEVFCQVKYEFL